MAPSTPSDSRTGSATPATAAGGTYTLESIIVGCKIFVQKPTNQGQMEERKAEILSVRDVSKMQYGRPPPVAAPAGGATAPTKEYYVHYVEFNKRLDEWIPSTRLLLGRELEWPAPAKPKKGSAADSGTATPAGSPARPQSLLKKATKAGSFSSTNQPASKSKSKGASSKKKGGADGDMEDAEGEDDDDALAGADPSTVAEAAVASGSLAAPSNPRAAPAVFSKADEIEKLRTSGSMTQSHGEISRVKNLNRIQIGGHEVEAWYFSAYPKEYAHIPVLYICEMCLSFFPSPMMLGRHRVKCTLHHPPGNEIYRHEDISFYEIDGRRQKTWCRNLCLLSKMFLDHKTLYYDVDPFLYYCMAKRDDTGCHLIGYFSKEKESAENYNVACILTLPQHQRHGYGKLLIEFSYELSKIEQKLGSPEKPLSDLGLLSYRAYWAETIVGCLLSLPADIEISIDEIAQKTALTHADVMHTCQAMSMLRFYKGQHVICLTDGVLEQYERAQKKTRRRIEPSKINWKPPTFSRDQLRFGW